MKKTILLVLMALMIATPCFAQETEPELITSIDGTVWGSCSKGFSTDPPYLYTDCEMEIGFYQKRQYVCYDGDCFMDGSIAYVNLGVVSVVLSRTEALWLTHRGFVFKAILQPQKGSGVFSMFYKFPRHNCSSTGHCDPAGFGYEVGSMYKINDDFTPYQIVYIGPNQLEQGAQFLVEIRTNNTRFYEKPPVVIDFYPPDGLHVSSINVMGNTTVAFYLEIATDAPIGFRDVSVTWDNGQESVTGNAVFEVLPKTN